MKLVHRPSLEWNCSIQHGKKDDASGPKITLSVISIFVPQNFWCYVSWGTTLLFHFVSGLNLFWDTKVSYFDLSFTIKKNVIQFDVSMCDIFWVNVSQTSYYLLENFLCKRLFESPTFSDIVKKITTSTKLHDNDDMLLGLDSFIDLDYMIVS